MNTFMFRRPVVLSAVLALAAPALGGTLPGGVEPSGRSTDAVVVHGTSDAPFLVKLARTQLKTANDVCTAAQGRPARLVNGRIEEAGKREYEAFHQERRSATYSVAHTFKPSAADPLCRFEIVPTRSVTISTADGDKIREVTFDPDTGSGEVVELPHSRFDRFAADGFPAGAAVRLTGKRSTIAGFRCEIVIHALGGDMQEGCVVDDPALPRWIHYKIGRNRNEGHKGFLFPDQDIDRIDPHARIDEAVFEVPPGVALKRRP